MSGGSVTFLDKTADAEAPRTGRTRLYSVNGELRYRKADGTVIRLLDEPDNLYLRLDCSNAPLTKDTFDLSFPTLTADAAILTTQGTGYGAGNPITGDVVMNAGTSFWIGDPSVGGTAGKHQISDDSWYLYTTDGATGIYAQVSGTTAYLGAYTKSASPQFNGIVQQAGSSQFNLGIDSGLLVNHATGKTELFTGANSYEFAEDIASGKVATREHTASLYLPLAGGTLTGTLAMDGGTVQSEEFIHIGEFNASTASAITNGRHYTGAVNAHGFSDATRFEPSTANKAFNSFDAKSETYGSQDMDHIVGFQSRVAHNGSGTLTDMWGLWVENIAASAVTNSYGVTVKSPTGVGVITNEYGIHVPTLNRGGTIWGAYIQGNDVYLGRDVEVKRQIKLTGSFGDAGLAFADNSSASGGVANIRGGRFQSDDPWFYFDLANAGANDCGWSFLTRSGNANVTAVQLESAGNPVLAKTVGRGIKVDHAAPTFPYRDLIGQRIVDFVGATAPTLAAFRGGRCRRYAFSAGDRQQWEFHIDHDIIAGAEPLYIHVHWMHNGTAISGNAVFTLTYTYAKGHKQQAYAVEKSQTITINTTNIATTPQWTEVVSEIQLSDATGTGNYLVGNDIEPDGLISCDVTMTTLPTITGGSPNEIFVTFVDIHYRSTGIGTKAKAPSFYT